MPPRAIRPKDEPLVSDPSDAASGRGGKRKAVSAACIPCRKRKSKCDGQVPSCSTCVAVYRTECSYDADTDLRRKGPVKRDESSSNTNNDALEVIVNHLKALPEDESIALLHSLRHDLNLDDIAESLRNHVGLPGSSAAQTLEADFAHQLPTPPTMEHDPSPFRPPPLQSSPKNDFASAQTIESSQLNRPVAWFQTPQDTEFLEHLLCLYHCWIQPFYSFVSWDHFTSSFRNGRTDFCSAMLANAIFAYACHYSDRSAARTDTSDPNTAGDDFFAEAKRLLDETYTPSLTTVQALGIMSLRETSAGRDSNGYRLAGRCVRMALELGMHRMSSREGLQLADIDVRQTTFWAVFSLETICAMNHGRHSVLPRSAIDVDPPSAGIRTDVQTWRPYEDTNFSSSPNPEQPARTFAFEEQLYKLSEITSNVVDTLYAPREQFTTRRLAAAYRRYRLWYQNLPHYFRLENTSLPHVLILHMYYYACVLHLFRPYMKYDLRSANLFPRDTCNFCANEISALMNALRAMYGLRRVGLAVIDLLLAASTMHLLNLPSESAAACLSQTFQDLDAMTTNHPCSARAAGVIRSLAEKWGVELPRSVAPPAVYRDQYRQEPDLHARTSELPARTSSVGTLDGGEPGRGLSPGRGAVLEQQSQLPPQSQQQRSVQQDLIRQHHYHQQQQQMQLQQAFYSNVEPSLRAPPAEHNFRAAYPGDPLSAFPQDTATTPMGLVSGPPQPHWSHMAMPEEFEHDGRQDSTTGRLYDDVHNLGGMPGWQWQ